MSETRICLRNFPQKLSKPRFLANTGPPRKPSSREKLPFARHIKYLLDRIVGIYILPLSSQGAFVLDFFHVTIFFNVALSETRICLRHLPKKLSKPRFLANTGPPRKPSSRENFPLPGILSIFWIESSVYIYYRYPPREDDGSIYTTVILPSRFFFKCSFVRNSNLFKTLAPKAFQAPFSRKYRPPRNPSSRENFPLPGILSIFWIESSVYIYYRYPPREDDGSIYTTVILPSRFFLNVALSETRICFRNLPQKLSKPRFLANTGPPRKPSSRENFPLPGILSIFWMESSVYIYTTVILPGSFCFGLFSRHDFFEM